MPSDLEALLFEKVADIVMGAMLLVSEFGIRPNLIEEMVISFTPPRIKERIFLVQSHVQLASTTYLMVQFPQRFLQRV